MPGARLDAWQHTLDVGSGRARFMLAVRACCAHSLMPGRQLDAWPRVPDAGRTLVVWPRTLDVGLRALDT